MDNCCQETRPVSKTYRGGHIVAAFLGALLLFAVIQKAFGQFQPCVYPNRCGVLTVVK